MKFHLFNVLAAGFRTAKAGAATSINCAVNPELNTQQCFYYADCKPSVSIPLSRLVWYEVRITSGRVSPYGMCNTSSYLAHVVATVLTFSFLYARTSRGLGVAYSSNLYLHIVESYFTSQLTKNVQQGGIFVHTARVHLHEYNMHATT